MPNHPSDPGNEENDPALLTARYSRALALSYRWHREQTRKGRETPYLAHLMSVSALVLEAGGAEELGIAGLLHDALEDAEDEDEADARREVIRQEFGERVLAAVEGCTDGTPDERKGMTWTERKQAYVAHIRSEAIADAVAVSLCDKLHNARSILRDVREAAARGVEEEFWNRFTGRRQGSLWYYAALEEAYRSRVPALTDASSESGPRLPAGFRAHLEELSRTVDALLESTGVNRDELK